MTDLTDSDSPVTRRRFLRNFGAATVGASLLSTGFLVDAVAAEMNDGSGQLPMDWQEYADAYRFLAAATFGPIPDDVAALSAPQGFSQQKREDWIKLQMDTGFTPQTVATEYMSAININDFHALQGGRALRDGPPNPDFVRAGGDDPCPVGYPDATLCTYAAPTNRDQQLNYIYQRNGRSCLYDVAMHGNDQLRQRVAFVLSNILVISDVHRTVASGAHARLEYWDLLARNAFGRFRTLIEDVVRSPMMGEYLSHRGNRKAGLDSQGNVTLPDENMARELLQLFTIGPVELAMDGTPVPNAPPTYHEIHDVRMVARVLTGLWDACRRNGDPSAKTDFAENFGGNKSGKWRENHNLRRPMVFWDDFHDFDEKKFPADGPFADVKLPAQTSADEELGAVLDALTSHPNVAPFICKQLIQGLTTSNPSPAYVESIATVFDATDGDLGEVVRAILLHPEFAELPVSETFGRIKDPLERQFGFFRAIGFTNGYPLHGFAKDSAPHIPSHLFQSGAHRTLYEDDTSIDLMLTQLLGAPSVFGYFTSTYRPDSASFPANLVAPEAIVLGGSRMAQAFNSQYRMVFATEPIETTDRPVWPNAGPVKHQQPITLGLDQFLPQATPQNVVMSINKLLFGYGMSKPMQERMTSHLHALAVNNSSAETLIKTAVMAALASPEYATQR